MVLFVALDSGTISFLTKWSSDYQNRGESHRHEGHENSYAHKFKKTLFSHQKVYYRIKDWTIRMSSLHRKKGLTKRFKTSIMKYAGMCYYAGHKKTDEKKKKRFINTQHSSLDFKSHRSAGTDFRSQLLITIFSSLQTCTSINKT